MHKYRYGETTRRTNRLERANKDLRRQVKELEAEIQTNFEEGVAQRHAANENIRAAQTETDAVRQQVGNEYTS